MGSMPPDAEARKDEEAASSGGAKPRLKFRAPKPVMRAWMRAVRFLHYVAADAKRRRNVSLGLAVLLNAVALSLLAIYGKVQIWIPSTPGETTVVMIDVTPAPLPDLRDPEVAPEPEQEAAEEEEPEIVETPPLEPEPAPNPVPKPALEVAPEPEPEPEAEIELEPDPVLAPPNEEAEVFIPEVDPGLEEEPGPLTITEEEGPSPEPSPPAADAEDPQTPAETEEPLVEETPSPETQTGLEVTEREEEPAEGEAARGEEKKQEEPSGDDMFDEEPTFGRPLALPSVNLPEGAAPASPGSSGVVAIFCPEEFKDADKIAECAGRTEIRSGWRPGASGEDWSKATRLLKQERQQGTGGGDEKFDPGLARAARQIQRQEDFETARPGAGGGTSADGSATGSTNVDRNLDRPDIGPKEPNPTWTLPQSDVSEGDLRKLERELDDADREKRPQQ